MPNTTENVVTVESVWNRERRTREVTQPTPLELMQAQADGLAELTDRVVFGDVVTFNPTNSTTVRHTFYAKVPALNDYTYSLFHVTYRLGVGKEGREYYPVDFLEAGTRNPKPCNDAAEFKAQLTEYLNRESVRSIIDQLKELGEKAIRRAR